MSNSAIDGAISASEATSPLVPVSAHNATDTSAIISLFTSSFVASASQDETTSATVSSTSDGAWPTLLATPDSQPQSGSQIASSESALTATTTTSFSLGPAPENGSHYVPTDPPLNSNADPIMTATPIPDSIRVAPLPTDSGGVFNSTVAITLNWTSPMLDFDDQGGINGGRAWKYNETTGYREWWPIFRARKSLHHAQFVGVGFQLNGSSSLSDDRPFNRTADPQDLYPWTKSSVYTTDRDEKLRSVYVYDKELGLLGAIDNLNVSRYEVATLVTSGTVFHNFTVFLPVKTQAANFTALRSQANTVPTFYGSGINPSMKFDVISDSIAKELQQKYNGSEYRRLPKPMYHVHGDHLLLPGNAEVAYNVPPNTTLIEVLGPVGNRTSIWWGDSECYAYLNPRPSWWLSSNVPTSRSVKPLNATEQTMFLFPIDPAIAFELRVGALGNTTTCPVSAFRTYPFHYDFSSSAENANGLNATQSKSKAKTTSVVVGVVVGVGGSLVLLALAIWYLRRRRSHHKESEKKFLPEPYINEEPVEPRTKAELEQMARGEEPRRSSNAGSSDEEGSREPRRRRGRRVVQEEDGESVVEYLPPQYREAWQSGGERGPSHHSEQDEPQLDPEVQQLDGPSSAPIQDRALAGKVGGLSSSSQPPLKQAYARVFNRALPRPPHSSVASDQRLPGSDTSDGGLKQEYKRRFGPRPQGARESDGVSSSASHEPGSTAIGRLAEKRNEQSHSSREDAELSSSISRPEFDRPLSSGSIASADHFGPTQPELGLKDEYKRWFS